MKPRVKCVGGKYYYHHKGTEYEILSMDDLDCLLEALRVNDISYAHRPNYTDYNFNGDWL